MPGAAGRGREERRVKAREMLGTLLAPGTFRSWDDAPADVRPDPAYAAGLAAARDRTGLDESVITGEGLLAGRRVAVAASEFGFLGGSIGVAAGERLARAVERATAERLPLIALPASGGTRMQEGTVAFLQMVKITTAVTAHKAARLPYIVYLRHPTTGGVLRLLGVPWSPDPGRAGRVHRLPRPPGLPGPVRRAVPRRRADRREPARPRPGRRRDQPGGSGRYLGRLLTAMTAQPRPVPQQETAADPAGRGGAPAWESIQRTREPGYPAAGDLIRAAATDVLPLHETGTILALARIGGYPCVLAAQDRHGPPPGPAALRVTRRGIHLAAGLGLPLVTVIDTPGAELSPEAEQDGLAGEIAHCLADLMALGTPTVSVLLGQGTGGAALALLPADRILAAEHAWLAPLAPEGASAIVFRDTSHAPDLAARQGVRATDLAAQGIIDRVIPEPPGDAGELCRGLGRAVHRALAELVPPGPGHAAGDAGRPVPSPRRVTYRGRGQTLVSLAQGVMIRTRREPKSTIKALSSSMRMTRPSPYLSCVTRSCTANCSAGGMATGGLLKGLPDRCRRDAARSGFIISSMRLLRRFCLFSQRAEAGKLLQSSSAPGVLRLTCAAAVT